MALRRHRLPRFWLALTLGSLTVAVGLVYWWERQLPLRVREAAATGRLDDCLRYSRQQAALRWLPGREVLEEGSCRRSKARQLWQQQRWSEALRLQGQLANSPAGGPADRDLLEAWKQELQRRAVARFRAGDLEGALASLQPLGEDSRRDGSAIGDELRQIWNRNRVQLKRAEDLAASQRWWEALDALHRLDHPWWQKRSAHLLLLVEAGVARLEKAHQEHDSHGSLPHTVPSKELEGRVQRRIAAGMDDWKAFQQACAELGGRVVEEGPESACRR